MSMRSVLRGAAEQVLVRLPRTTKAGDKLILAYHNVVPNSWVPRGDVSLHMPLHKFEAQLRMIRDEAEIVPLMELLTTEAPSTRRVAITFDDAYASALELGVGACVAAGAACTVFVTPGLFGTVPVWDRRAVAGTWSAAERDAFLWDGEGRGGEGVQAAGRDHANGIGPLAISTLAQLERVLATVSPELLTLGNHSMTHANLGALSNEEAHGEIAQCDAWLREHVASRCVPVVAYPYGISPKDASVAARGTDVTLGLLAAGGWYGALAAGQQLLVPRWNVPAGVSNTGFGVRFRGRMLNG